MVGILLYTLFHCLTVVRDALLVFLFCAPFLLFFRSPRAEKRSTPIRAPRHQFTFTSHTFTCIRKPQTDRDARLFFTFVILARRGHPIIIFEYIFTHMHVWVEYLIFLFLEFVLDLVLLRLWIAHGDVIARRAQTRLNQTECCVNVKELRQVAFGQRLG